MKKLLLAGLAFLAWANTASAQICSGNAWGASPGSEVVANFWVDRFCNRNCTIVYDYGSGQTISDTKIDGGLSHQVDFIATDANQFLQAYCGGGRCGGASCHFEIVSVGPAPVNVATSSWPVDDEGKALMRQYSAWWDDAQTGSGVAAAAWAAASAACGGCFAPEAVFFGSFSAISPIFKQHYSDLALDPEDNDYCTGASQQPQSADALGLQYVGDWINDGLVSEAVSIDSYFAAAYASANKMNTAARDQSGCFADRQNDTAWFLYAAGYELENFAWYSQQEAQAINDQVGDNGYADWLRDLANQLYDQGENLKAR